MARALTTGRVRRNRRPADEYQQDVEGLRSIGMSYEAIAKALWWFCGAELTGEQVAYALAVWGERPQVSKARR